MTRNAAIQQGSGIAEALRLLAGSSDEALRGLCLIDSAAERGDSAALERLALFEAVGWRRPQNWQRALDCLQRSAELGSPRARDQMLILARMSPAEIASNVDWGRIRSQIRFEQLLAPPAKRAICDTPRLRVIDGFASSHESAWLIEQARSRLRPAVVVVATGEQLIQTARTNSAVEFQLADMDLVLEVVRARISAATRLPLPLFEPTQVLHYAPGQEFRPHHDYFDPRLPGHSRQLELGQRIGTFLLYLNEDYAGGETDFPRAQLSFRGRTGDALFLANVDRSGQPDPMSLHSGMPPTSGEKWILSQWIRDRLPTAEASE